MNHLPFVLLLLPMSLAAEGLTFHLLDAEKNSEIRVLKDGETLPPIALSIEARVDREAKSVQFELEGPTGLKRVESTAPFTLGGDSGGHFRPVELKAGDYILKADILF